MLCGVAIKFFIGFFKYIRIPVAARNDSHRVALVDNWLWGYVFSIVYGVFPIIAYIVGSFTIGMVYYILEGS